MLLVITTGGHHVALDCFQAQVSMITIKSSKWTSLHLPSCEAGDWKKNVHTLILYLGDFVLNNPKVSGEWCHLLWTAASSHFWEVAVQDLLLTVFAVLYSEMLKCIRNAWYISTACKSSNSKSPDAGAAPFGATDRTISRSVSCKYYPWSVSTWQRERTFGQLTGWWLPRPVLL